MKKHLSSSFFYLVIGFLPLASNFLITPFFTRYLLPEEYGILALAALFQAYITIFLSSGIDGAFSRLFFNYYKKPVLLNAFFSTVLCSVAGISAACSLVLYLFGDQIFSFVFSNDQFVFTNYGYLAFVTAVTSLLHALALTYYRNSEDLKGFGVLAVSFFVLMTIGSVVGVMVLHLGAWGSLAGKMIGSVVVVLGFLVYFYSKNRFVFRSVFLKPVFKYGLPLIPYVLLGITLDNLDRFLIERYISLSELGKYNIAFLIASVSGIFIQSLSSAVNPSIYKLLENRNEHNQQTTDKEIATLFKGIHLFILFVISGAVMLCEPLIKVLIDEEYHSLINYLPLLFLAFIPRLYYIIFALPLFFHHKTKLLPFINLVALVLGGTIMFVLLQKFGIVGVCLGVIFIKSIQMALAIYYVKTTGHYHSSMFSLQSNHVLSAILFLAVIGAVVIGQVWPNVRFIAFVGSGLVYFVGVLLLFLPELRVLKSKLQTAVK